MNEIEKGQLCDSVMSAIHHGLGNLETVPALLRRIIENRAWECRQVKMRGVVKLANLRELITKEPMDGWGENPDRIEGLIRDDAEVLAMWREAMKGQEGGNTTCNIVTGAKATTGNSRAYTVSRLQREAPELFAQVAAGTISANAAAIKAGFRKKPTPLDQLNAAWSKASDEERHRFLNVAVSEDEEGNAAFAKGLDEFCAFWASDDDENVNRDEYSIHSVIFHNFLQNLHKAGVSFLWPDWKTTGRGKEGLSHYLQLANDEVELGKPDEVAKQIKYKTRGDYARSLRQALEDELKQSSTTEAA
jgi:hypothetical protein